MVESPLRKVIFPRSHQLQADENPLSLPLPLAAVVMEVQGLAPPLPLTSSVALDKCLGFSEPQFPDQ